MKKKSLKHAVMMEYVLIAVLIAAAVVMAVIMFGKTLTKEMNVATTAMVNPTTAASDQETNRGKVNKSTETATKHANTMHGFKEK